MHCHVLLHDPKKLLGISRGISIAKLYKIVTVIYSGEDPAK